MAQETAFIDRKTAYNEILPELLQSAHHNGAIVTISKNSAAK
jgi:hypothetical protein